MDWLKYSSYLLNVVCSIVCILLFAQNKELRQTLASTTTVAQVEPLQAGEKVEAFTITTLDGATRQIAYADPTRKYLFFVLSTSCPHCERTLPLWKSLAEINDDNCYILGISLQNLDETMKYFSTKDVGFYIVSVKNDTSFSRKYKISGVPATILVNGNGIVERAWIGALTQEQTTEIRNLMSAATALVSN